MKRNGISILGLTEVKVINSGRKESLNHLRQVLRKSRRSWCMQLLVSSFKKESSNVLVMIFGTSFIGFPFSRELSTSSVCFFTSACEVRILSTCLRCFPLLVTIRIFALIIQLLMEIYLYCTCEQKNWSTFIYRFRTNHVKFATPRTRKIQCWFTDI